MTIRTDNGEWAVFTEWLGAERVVFRGSIWACIAFRADPRPHNPKESE